MQQQTKSFALILLLAFLATPNWAATITGSVTGADGAPFQGAFVEAQNTKTKITTIVLSDSQGHYRIPDLPAGDYRVQIKAVGFRADPRTGVSAHRRPKRVVRFRACRRRRCAGTKFRSTRPRNSGPPAKGKDLLFGHCNICHQFQTRMASVHRDPDGWKDRVAFMRDAMHFSVFLGPHFSDQDADTSRRVSEQSFRPGFRAAEISGGYAGVSENGAAFQQRGDEHCLRRVRHARRRAACRSAPLRTRTAIVWIPDFGVANKITRLDPKTGEMQDFPVPNIGTAAIHSAVPAPDGSVWIAEQGSNKLGRWDPATQKITEYQDAYLPGKEGIEDGGSKHTVRIDPSGKVWASGVPLTSFDPETGKFTRFDSGGGYTYDVKPDKNGDVWFTDTLTNKIGKVDGKTRKFPCGLLRHRTRTLAEWKSDPMA